MLNVDKLSHRLHDLLPDFVQSESPEFVAFLEAYFEFLQNEIITLSSQTEIQGILIEDGTGSMLLEPATTSPSPDSLTSKIRIESNLVDSAGNVKYTPFTKGEYVVGSISKSVAKINVINGLSFYVETIHGSGFISGETITGRTSGQTGVIGTYKENTVLANNRLLSYADIDKTSDDFLQYYQNDFMPQINPPATQDRRLIIKHIKELYEKKGTTASLQFLMRILYGQDADVYYPIDHTLHVSDSSYVEYRNMVVSCLEEPSPTDKITAFNGNNIVAEAVIENVYLGKTTGEYLLQISERHSGTFTQGMSVKIRSRSNNLDIQDGTVVGIISGLDESSSTNKKGALYTINDRIDFEGDSESGTTFDVVSVVDGLTTGSIDEIYIENAGTGFVGGDLVIFNNINTHGDNAMGIISAIGFKYILESGSGDGHFYFTASAGQTAFTGSDDYSQTLAFTQQWRRVFVDGVEKTEDDFTVTTNTITFNSALSAGQIVEVYTEEADNLLSEDGFPILQETATNPSAGVGNSAIRNVKLINSGDGYLTLPTCAPGGYLYMKDTTGFVGGETITGGTSSATAKVVLVEPDKKLLVCMRETSDTGIFVVGEVITGSSSEATETLTGVDISNGSGASLIASSSTIGGIGSLNIQDVGSGYTKNAKLKTTSISPLLYKDLSYSGDPTLNPGIVITGATSGVTATVYFIDAGKNILKLQNATGVFLKEEKVTFTGGTLRVLEYKAFNGKGLLAGEAMTGKGETGDYGALNSAEQKMHDNRIYQSHSYVIRIGESINKWRSAVKDLLHPAGHIFFGEVQVSNNFDTSMSTTFLPTIIINSDAVTAAALGASVDYDKIILIENLFNEITVLEPAGVPAVGVDAISGGTIGSYATTGGVQRGKGTEWNDPSIRQRHINLLQIKTVATASTPSFFEHDGVTTTLNIDSNNGFENQNREETIFGTRARPADVGRVIQMWTPEEEKLILEDGNNILQEPEVNRMRLEPLPIRTSVQDFGGEMIYEDGDFIELEDATENFEEYYFTTERSMEPTGQSLVSEDGTFGFASEDGDRFIQESGQTNGIYSFAPLGTTLRSLNIITGQDVHDISYYLKHEDGSAHNSGSHGDNIAMEDGQPPLVGGSANPLYSETGINGIINEVSKPEGLRISDLESVMPNFFIPQFEQRERTRTNFTFSATVKSG